MRAFTRKRRRGAAITSVHREDPLAGVANLFDASIVFAVGLASSLAALAAATGLAKPR